MNMAKLSRVILYATRVAKQHCRQMNSLRMASNEMSKYICKNDSLKNPQQNNNNEKDTNNMATGTERGERCSDERNEEKIPRDRDLFGGEKKKGI